VDTTRNPIAQVSVTLQRSWVDELTDEENDQETAAVHALFEDFPEVGPIKVFDRGGFFLYFAAGREG
jgi:hypothetical protein